MLNQQLLLEWQKNSQREDREWREQQRREDLKWKARQEAKQEKAARKRERTEARRFFLQLIIGWILATDYEEADLKMVHDLSRYPELRWLDRYHWVPGILLAVLCFLIGGWSTRSSR